MFAAPFEATLLLYSGPSMHPLFRGGDLLEVVPSGATGVRAGDVIAFTEPAGSVVVHRVVAVTAAGLVSRGDNNDRLDDAPVRADQVLGRVRLAHRGGRRIAVAGGRRGRLVARVLRLRRQVAPVLRGPYRMLRRWLERFPAPVRAGTRAVTFASGEILVTRLVVPGRRKGVR